ncbi:hypothetical protein N7468_000564 [Penicillium chermesinum]|uniref:Ankyrin repeat protein n=1 Tax=Penicillium chermesinum TaxID=63820 RepID=A0A9W9PMA0_9EURO|nr:uncharacterized protein N7468_000564 [Penicillium chermesinum]KAJ5249113.1 hypothetical protein N7468_000564 [Penicillium chermesinum]
MDLDELHQMVLLREVASVDNIEEFISIFTQVQPSLIDNKTFEAETIPILHEAIRNDSFRVIDYLLDQKVPMRPFLFQEATKNTSYRVLESFLNHGFDINTPIDTNNPPAIAGIATPLHYAAGKGLLDSVKVLVDGGAWPYTKDPSGLTAIDWAQMNRHVSVVEFLRSLPAGDSFQQFTDAPGKHFTPVALETLLRETGLKLV